MDQEQGTSAPQGAGTEDEAPAKLGFSKEFLNDLKRAPWAAPESIVVAGDPSTPEGAELAGTLLDDGRAALPWSDEHERIVMGLLTGSEIVRVQVPVFGEDGQQKREVRKVAGREIPVAVWDHREVAVSVGLPLLVYLQGYGGDSETPGDWYALMNDGRQRRRAQIELQRRVDWLANLITAAGGDHLQRKPGRRNLLKKLAKSVARGRTWIDFVADQTPHVAPGTFASVTTGDLVGEDGLTTLPLPGKVSQYDSPEVGNSLLWLSETFCEAVCGTDDLGDGATSVHKRGWLVDVRSTEPIVETTEDGKTRSKYPLIGMTAMRSWAKIQVCGVNIDPHDPTSLLNSVAMKAAEVDTPASTKANQIVRLLGARLNPGDPNSPALYSRKALCEKFRISEGTMRNYELLDALCDEVKALIDAGTLSQTVALGAHNDADMAAFVYAPSKGVRAVLPPDKQRLVLDHMIVSQINSDGTEDDTVRFKGKAAAKLGKRLRDDALSGKLRPVGAPAEAPAGGGRESADPDAGEAAVVAPVRKPRAGADGASGASGSDDSAHKPGRKPAMHLDPTLLRENFGRAYSSPPLDRGEMVAAANGSGVSTDFSQYLNEIDLARSVALVIKGVEPIALLDKWPAVRDALVASVPAGKGAAPQDDRALVGDFIASAVEQMVADGKDVPVVTLETVSSDGKTRPTPEQCVAANAKIDEWRKQYEAVTDGSGAASLDEHLLRLAAAEGAAPLT